MMHGPYADFKHFKTSQIESQEGKRRHPTILPPTPHHPSSNANPLTTWDAHV